MSQALKNEKSQILAERREKKKNHAILLEKRVCVKSPDQHYRKG